MRFLASVCRAVARGALLRLEVITALQIASLCFDNYRLRLGVLYRVKEKLVPLVA